MGIATPNLVWHDRRGTTALEFAIVAPVFLLLLIGTLYLGMMLLLTGSLYNAVEDGARCAAVKTTICTDSASTIAYAQSRYFGPSPLPIFTYAAAACGQSVSGSVNYVFDFGMTRATVPISVTACHP